eukprot:c46213_g1_i1.p1 GENE.c46213_g1_i1~~c46213_g1_i1.p1  ORF type:complete len:138 (+),score=6.42 c46213_g1_i1:695-1108(+)
MQSTYRPSWNDSRQTSNSAMTLNASRDPCFLSKLSASPGISLLRIATISCGDFCNIMKSQRAVLVRGRLAQDPPASIPATQPITPRSEHEVVVKVHLAPVQSPGPWVDFNDTCLHVIFQKKVVGTFFDLRSVLARNC